jgi:transcriptional regulator with XRE-family HTH domain
MGRGNNGIGGRTVHAALEAERKRRHMRRKDVADALGVQGETMRRWGHGMTEPTWGYIKAAHDAFSIPYDELFGEPPTGDGMTKAEAWELLRHTRLAQVELDGVTAMAERALEEKETGDE